MIRDDFIQIRLSKKLKKAISKEAKSSGESVTRYMLISSAMRSGKIKKTLFEEFYK